MPEPTLFARMADFQGVLLDEEEAEKRLVTVPPYVRADGTRVDGYSYRRGDGGNEERDEWELSPHAALTYSELRNEAENEVYEAVESGDFQFKGQDAFDAFDSQWGYEKIQASLRDPDGVAARLEELQASPGARSSDEDEEYEQIRKAVKQAVYLQRYIERKASKDETPGHAIRITGMDWLKPEARKALKAGKTVEVRDAGFFAVTESLEFADFVSKVTAKDHDRHLWNVFPTPSSAAMESEFTSGPEWVFPPRSRLRIKHSGLWRGKDSYDVEVLPP